MGRLIVTTFLSLDGVMQAPGATNEDMTQGFSHGGWTVPYADADFGKIMFRWFAAAGAFLLGRRTFELFSAYWPKVTDSKNKIAQALNTLPKYVVSRTLGKTDWKNTVFIREDVYREIVRLKQNVEKELQVHGSGLLAQTLLNHDLVDELRLLVYPVVLGTGKRLFENDLQPQAFKLAGSLTTSQGVSVLTYRSAGKPAYGSFELEEGAYRAKDVAPDWDI